MEQRIEKVFRLSEIIKLQQGETRFDLAVSGSGFAFTVNTPSSSVVISDEDEFKAIAEVMYEMFLRLNQRGLNFNADEIGQDGE